MSDIKEKISAFYDGELNLSSKEIDELIIFINENPSLSCLLYTSDAADE